MKVRHSRRYANMHERQSSLKVFVEQNTTSDLLRLQGMKPTVSERPSIYFPLPPEELLGPFVALVQPYHVVVDIHPRRPQRHFQNLYLGRPARERNSDCRDRVRHLD